ncbi:hypothetical protein ACF0H5_015365 [Mactra antiquata]
MTWEPTHVQFTVLRARNLVGKLKGKNSAKITDVFVTINLGKEKFQTSTIKYSGKVNNSVEWFEECDLPIPSIESEVDVQVMNRGLLSDEFIGYTSVPLKDFDFYERPKSHWVQLGQKPSKLPDGRCRGELEIRLTFHVKSRNDDSSSNSSLKGKRAGSIKSLVTAVGDKLKFTRTRSLRGDGTQIFSSPQSHKTFKNSSTKTVPYTGGISQTNSPVKFEAVDLYVPEQCWRENEFDNDLGDGNFARSYSLTSDKRRNNRDFKSRSLMNLHGEGSSTLPSRGHNRQRPSLDDSAIGPSLHMSSRSSRSSVTSQEGYLENMFRKECEVDERMNDVYNEHIEEDSEGEYNETRRRSAQMYNNPFNSDSDSSESSEESDEDEKIQLPKVKLKSNGSHRNSEVVNDDDNDNETRHNGDDNDDRMIVGAESAEDLDNEEEEEFDVFGESPSPGEYTSELDRIIAREQSRSKSNALNSQGNSDGHTSTHTSSSSISYQGKTAAERAFERGSTDSMSGSRRKISPKADFSFTNTSMTSTDDHAVPLKRRSKQYSKGGRRFTVQGLEGIHKYKSAPDIRDKRPVYGKEDAVPEDLMAVYRNMNREELVSLVVTHKAQLIRKDQYIRELENYIDNLLVRVMEDSPRILQNL